MKSPKKSPQERFSPEEYLQKEEKAEEKHEFLDGEILAMSGGSAKHNMLSANMIITLGTHFRSRGCKVFSSDMKIDIAEHNHFVYPDMAVVCGDISFTRDRDDIIDNPTLICEVLSDSTEAYDRGRKFHKYRSLASLKEYILVSQHESRIEIYSRQDETIWRMASYGPGQQAQLSSLDISFAVDEIYLGV